MIPTAKGIIFKKQKYIHYPNIDSALKPVHHTDVLLLPQLPVNYSLSVEEECMPSNSNENKTN